MHKQLHIDTAGSIHACKQGYKYGYDVQMGEILQLIENRRFNPCVYTYIPSYIQTYMHTYIHTYIDIHTYLHVYLYIYIYIYNSHWFASVSVCDLIVHVCMYLCMYEHIQTHLPTYIHAYIHTIHITWHNIRTYIHTYIHAHTHTHILYRSIHTNVCVCVCVCVCMYACTQAPARMCHILPRHLRPARSAPSKTPATYRGNTSLDSSTVASGRRLSSQSQLARNSDEPVAVCDAAGWHCLATSHGSHTNYDSELQCQRLASLYEKSSERTLLAC